MIMIHHSRHLGEPMLTALGPRKVGTVDPSPTISLNQAMIDFDSSSPHRSDPDSSNGPWFRLEIKILARLERLADVRGISVAEALNQLLEAATCHLQADGNQASHVLSKKQAAVLESLRAGLSVKEIAGQLGVLEDTVRTHIYRIRRRLNHSDLLSLRFLQDDDPGVVYGSFEPVHRPKPPHS